MPYQAETETDTAARLLDTEGNGVLLWTYEAPTNTVVRPSKTEALGAGPKSRANIGGWYATT